MFTGIIEELGEVVAIDTGTDSSRITVRGEVATSGAAHGASIAVNGACLTVTDTEAKGGEVTFDVMAESLRRTGLGDLAVGDAVNLERAMVLGERLGRRDCLGDSENHRRHNSNGINDFLRGAEAPAQVSLTSSNGHRRGSDWL